MSASEKLQKAHRQRIHGIAEAHMSIKLQMELALEEKEIYYQHLIGSQDYISDRLQRRSGIEKLDGWIVCGSGLASLPNSKDIKILDTIFTQEIPNWPVPQAEGHGKELFIADIGGQIVGIQTGRQHIYDTDNSPRQLKMITAPLIVAKGLGVDWLTTTNAAGVLDNGKIKEGDVVVDVDYVNQHGVNPLMGLNDERLGIRFPGKRNVADPYMYKELEKFIPEDRLHLGIYSLSSQSPMYEGGGDVIRGMYDEFLRQNPELVQAYGMSFAIEAMIMQHFNNPPVDVNGFDRQIRWIGLTATTNIIGKPVAPTKDMLRTAAMPDANPATHKEVLDGGTKAEQLLIPGVIGLCKSFTQNPLPPIT